MRRLALLPVVCAFLATAPAARAGQAVTYRQDLGHTSSASEPGLQPPLRELWSRRLGDNQGSTNYQWYAIVADGRVFVPVGIDGQNAELVALDAATGQTLWTASSHYGIELAYDAGRLFASSDDLPLRAFDPATGHVLWTAPSDKAGDDSAPSAADGLVVFTEPGGYVAAVRESDGSTAWRTPQLLGDESDVALSGANAFVSFIGGQVYDLETGSGQVVWHRTGPSFGGGLGNTALSGGRIWTADRIQSGHVVDAASGADTGTFDGNAEPSLGCGMAVMPLSGSLHAEEATGGAAMWDHPEPDAPGTPLLVDGTAFVPFADGRLEAVALGSGATTWTGSAPAEIRSLAAGEGRLFATGGGVLTAYAGSGASVPCPGSATAGATAPTSAQATGAAAQAPGAPAARPAGARRCSAQPRSGRRVVITCSFAKGAKVHATLLQGRRVLARLAGRSRGGRVRLALTRGRRPRPGRYTLRLEAGRTHATLSVSVPR